VGRYTHRPSQALSDGLQSHRVNKVLIQHPIGVQTKQDLLPTHTLQHPLVPLVRDRVNPQSLPHPAHHLMWFARVHRPTQVHDTIRIVNATVPPNPDPGAGAEFCVNDNSSHIAMYWVEAEISFTGTVCPS